jgi:vacuolar protein-sorting-associated protein 4
MVQISEKRIFVRKAKRSDFEKAIENCKPTVNSVFLELYSRFLDKYGHSDQKEFGEIQ